MNEQIWNKFIDENPDSTFFHQIEWKRVIEKVYGFKPHYMIAKEWDGILPFFEIKQISGKKLISVPFSTEGGVLYKSEKAKNTLLNAAKTIVKEKKLDYFELRQRNIVDSELKNKDYYVHMKLKLSYNPENIWKNADKKMRNAVRKAQTNNLTTDKGIKYLDDFYNIFAENMRDLGTPVEKKCFFQEIINHFPGQVNIVVSKLKGRVISAVFLLIHKKTIKAEWASSLRKYFGYNANQLMYWRAIEDACKEGYETFDFGRSVEGEGTYMFKKKFGAKPEKINYQYYLNNSSMPDIRKTNWKRKIFANCWKLLPLFIANRLGPLIRRQFP